MGRAQNIKDEDKIVKNNPIVTGRIAFKLLLNNSLNPLPLEMFSIPTISINKFWVDAFSTLDVRPNITEKKNPLPDHEKYKNEENKFDKYFEENI